MDTQPCPVSGCTAPQSAKLPLCAHHYLMAPSRLKSALHDEYRSGQDTRNDATPAYKLALERLIGAVEEIEAKADQAARQQQLL